MPHNQLAPTTISFSDADSGVLSWPVDAWAAALEPPTVLVAEDDDDIREIVVLKLQAAGYRTLATGNGRTAMSLALNERPQLVVLDVTMPGLDGLGLCYELHSSPQTAHIPVIIISGRGEPSDLDLARIVGAEDYLVKPFTMAELLRRVERLVPVAAA